MRVDLPDPGLKPIKKIVTVNAIETNADKK